LILFIFSKNNSFNCIYTKHVNGSLHCLGVCPSCLILLFLWNGSYAKGKLLPSPIPLLIVENILPLRSMNTSKSISMVNPICQFWLLLPLLSVF
uniref:Uncharacterized protein n=1 Tax=Theropithecus gelada TaxID=9565 RepID=A0A8D2E3C7_THEGE